MVTRKAADVMSPGLSGPAAADAAGITYRQLDYWERNGWITAAQVVQANGSRRVRRYSTDDIVRLAALRHLGLSKLDVGYWGAKVGETEILEGHALIVGTDRDGNDVIEVVPIGRVVAAVNKPGRWTVFDPGEVRHRCKETLRRESGEVRRTA